MLFSYAIFKDVLVQAYYALSDNRLRTILSILGVSVGITAVITVGTINKAATNYIYSELKTYGLKTLWVYRDWPDAEPGRAVRQSSGISNDDYRLLAGGCCSDVVRVSPVVYADKDFITVNFGSRHFDSNLEGVGIDYIPINNDHLLLGRNFRRDDILRRKSVAIVGTGVVEALFGKHANPLGKSFRAYEQKFTIIGVLEQKRRDLLKQIGADNYDVNARILIPYSVYQSILGVKDIHTLQAEASSLENTKKALNQITDMLQRRHGNRFEYITESMDEWIETANSVLRGITFIGLIAAALVLLVGGMAIMSIMSTTVIERTREIGIRKAIGAQDQDIKFQFLMEAMFISTIGGMIGLFLGIAIAYLIALVSGYPVTPSWITAAIAVFISMIIGLMSGYYPAHRAAQLKPVDALRYE